MTATPPADSPATPRALRDAALCAIARATQASRHDLARMRAEHVRPMAGNCYSLRISPHAAATVCSDELRDWLQERTYEPGALFYAAHPNGVDVRHGTSMHAAAVRAVLATDAGPTSL